MTPSFVVADRRRSFEALPVAWAITDAATPEAVAVAAALRRRATAAGDALLDLGGPGELPRLWFPVAAVHVGDDPPAVRTLPASAARGCITAGDAPAATARWDAALPLARTRADTALTGFMHELRSLARARQTAALEHEAQAPPRSACDVSVVVCTFRRSAALARALDSIAAQDFPAARFEVVVVNNDPTDAGVPGVVEDLRASRFGGHAARLRLVDCAFPGLSFARNAGIAQARGAVLSFIDDDAVARPDWLARVWQAFEDHPTAGVVGGRITVHAPERSRRWLRPGWEKYWSGFALDGGTAPRVAGHWWGFPFGANWSARRASLVAIGGFRADYGRRGRDASGGEEIVAAALVQGLGQAVVIAPEAQVEHRPDPDRFTLAHVRRRIVAAKREEYLQQRAGYIPPELSAAGATRDLVWRIGRAALGRRRPLHLRLEDLFYAYAEARLAPRLLRDALVGPS